MATLVFFSTVVSSFAQQMERRIHGKPVKQGYWKNQQIEYVESLVSICLRPGVEKADILPVLQKHQATVKYDVDKLGWLTAELPAGKSVLSTAVSFQQEPLIKWAEPVVVLYPSQLDEFNDEFYQDGHQWGMKNINQNPPFGVYGADSKVWAASGITRGNSNVAIAILVVDHNGAGFIGIGRGSGVVYRIDMIAIGDIGR